MADFESAMADIPLFGTKRQVELSQRISREFAETKSVSLDELLKDLREDMRELLQLEKLPADSLLIVRWKEK